MTNWQEYLQGISLTTGYSPYYLRFIKMEKKKTNNQLKRKRPIANGKRMRQRAHRGKCSWPLHIRKDIWTLL